MAFTKVVGPGIHTLAQLRTHNIHSVGIITATKFVGEMESGGGESTFQNVTVQGNLTVQGDQTTLNTTLRNVELLRVSTASTLPAGIITQTGSGNILEFFDSSTNVGALTDEGNLGLGVNLTSPNVKLHVKSTATDGGNIAYFDDSGSGATGRLMILTTGGFASADGIKFQTVNRRYTFFGNATNHLTIDNNNATIGIGSDTPGRALTITNTEPRIRLQDADTGGHAEIYTDNNHNLQFSADSSSSSGSSQFFFRVNGTEKVRIQEDGDIIYGPGDHIIGGDPALIQGQGSHHNNNMSTITYGINDGGNTCGMRVENFDDGTYNAQRVKFLTAKGGYSMATVRMTIDELGNVGIGSTIPAKKLDVNGTAQFQDDINIKSGNPIILANAANSASTQILCDGGARLHLKSYNETVATFEEGVATTFYQSSGTNRFQIAKDGGIHVGAGGTIYMPEYIKHSGNNITYFGFSGDNTFKIYTNDAQRLQINNTGVFQFNHTSVGGYYNFQGPTSDNNWGGYLKLNSYNNSTVKAEIRASTNGLWFQYGDHVRLDIDNDGAINIGHNPAQATGTNTQNAILTIKGYPGGNETSAAILALVRGNNTTDTAADHTMGRIVFSDKQAGEYALIEGEAEANGAVGDTPGRLVFSTAPDNTSAPTEKLRIASDGAVGVNNTSPSSQYYKNLVVGSNDAGSWGITVRTNSANSGNLAFSDTDSANAGRYDGRISYEHTDQSMRFHTNAAAGGTTERLRINSSGRVGINTTTVSMDGVTGNLNIANTNYNNHTVINLSRNTINDRSQIRFSNPNGNVGSIDTFGSDLIVSSGNDLKLRTNGDERLIITSTGLIRMGNGAAANTESHITAAIFQNVTGTATILKLGNTNTPSSANNRAIEFCDGTGGTEGSSKYTYARIKAERAGGSNSGRLIFSTKPDNSSDAQKAIEITPDGDVLIGNGNVTTQEGDGRLIVYANTRLHPAIKADCIDGGINRANGFTLLADNYGADESNINFGISYSGAGLVLSRGVKVSNTADDAYLSSMDSYAMKPAVFKLDDDGSFRFLNTNTSATTTTDSAVTLYERLRIKSDGEVLIGTGGVDRPIAGQRFNSGNGWGGTLQIEKPNPNGNNNNVPFLAITAFNGANEQYTGGISFNRSNSNTQGTQGAVNTNQQLGNISFNGSDGTNFIQGAEIFAIPDQTFTTNDGPASLVFATTPDGTSEDEPQERLRIDSSGRLLINKTTNRQNYFNGGYTGQLQVEGTNDSTRLTQFIHNSNDTASHILVIGKSRGTSTGSYTAVQDNDYLGTLSFQGADGDEMVDGARIEARVNGTPGNDDMHADMIFRTNHGQASPRERLRITAKGKLLQRQDSYSETYQPTSWGNAYYLKGGWMRFNSNFSNPTKDLVILADGGNANNNLFIKVTVVQLDYPGTQQALGSIHIGYASAKRYGDGTGKWYVDKSTMALEPGSNFHGIYSNVGTLSWENANNNDTNTLRYTSNRYANYDLYNVQVEVWENGNCPYYLHSDFVE